MTQSSEAQQNSTTHILVAEDDQVTRMLLKKILEQAGYHADCVADGQAAVAALQLMDYDLILMDCYMPRLDGFATTQLIRHSSSADINSKIPVIAMTGLSGEQDRARCLDAGMDDHIGKPVRADELILAIEKNLGRAASRIAQGAGAVPLALGAAEPALEGDFLDTLLDRFLAEIPDVVKSLALAAEGRDLAELERIGHRLRGTSDVLEMRKLSSRSRALEQAGKNGESALAVRLTAEMIGALQKIAAALQHPAS